MPLEPVDLVLLEQEGDALDVRLHRRVLVRQHLFEVELGAGPRCRGFQAVAGLGVDFGRMQQRLGWNAADIEAGAARGGRFSITAILRPSCAALIAQT